MHACIRCLVSDAVLLLEVLGPVCNAALADASPVIVSFAILAFARGGPLLGHQTLGILC
ncbi:hypothetical protein DPMN_083754 [Dreissena polymorpha]|uniref:Uncharacterized protein n=1 Tax=Dreissena polymorpha TaxID=45954 RepID=A0A9D3YDI7_DREPO|nr:hypothetical protein DPMN_083754 [Dreissena polymorpha]